MYKKMYLLVFVILYQKGSLILRIVHHIINRHNMFTKALFTLYFPFNPLDPRSAWVQVKIATTEETESLLID